MNNAHYFSPTFSPGSGLETAPNKIYSDTRYQLSDVADILAQTAHCNYVTGNAINMYLASLLGYETKGYIVTPAETFTARICNRRFQVSSA